jgi:hypothetical protein
MRTVVNLAVVYAMSLPNIRPPPVDLFKIFISVTLRKKVTLLADYCRTFFLDIV